MPKTAPRKKVDVIRSFGCELVEEGEGYDAAEAFAMKLENLLGEGTAASSTGGAQQARG